MNNYNPFSLTGKVILITGASSGIGRATAIECSRMGAQVVLTGRNAERLSQTLGQLEGEGHIMIAADLTLRDDIGRLVEQLPVLDGIVQNAGMNKLMTCQFIKEDQLENVMKTNVEAPIMLQKAILKKRKLAGGGSVVFLSSSATFRPAKGNAVYAATKGAIMAYSKVLALELAPQKIRVNCVHPAMVWTELLSLSKEEYELDEQKYPLKRYGRPEEIAYLIVYLLSDASQWVTGSSMLIDGGKLLS